MACWEIRSPMSEKLNKLKHNIFTKLEKAQEQERLLEESAQELAERRAREQELQKKIKEKEVGFIEKMNLLEEYNQVIVEENDSTIALNSFVF